MATNTNTPTTLGNLEFSEIKNSLTNYLKNQSIFAGYNFDGTALQTLIDLLSYNTFYYAYYANMINAESFLDSAQKLDSIISLCKPLGYTVPARTAAKATIQLSGISTNQTIPAGTRFVASNSNGFQYSFYNLLDVGVVNNTTPQFDIYQGINYIEFDALPTFDYDAQKINIVSDNFDLSSIRVIVTETVDEVTTLTDTWTRVDNINYSSRADENIYFVERTTIGFAILFGGKNSVGRAIDSNINKIMVRYITTSGSEANSLSLFNSTIGGVVTLVSQSSGGETNPNLDKIKFFAPRMFASQERAVTVNDYKALLINAGFFGSDREFNVFGGEELVPAKYGRVFITSNINPNDEKISEMITFLRERSVVTIFPEYVSAKGLRLYVDFKFSLGPGTDSSPKSRSSIISRVKRIFDVNYGTVNQLNVSFSASNFIDILRSNSSTDINTLLITPDDFTLYVKESLDSGKDYLFNLENELNLPLNTQVDITLPFDSDLVPNGFKAVLKMYAQTNGSKNVKTNLQLWQKNNDTGAETQLSTYVGYYVANAGVVFIKSGVVKNNATMQVNFLRNNITIGLNNLITFTYNNVTIT